MHLKNMFRFAPSIAFPATIILGLSIAESAVGVPLTWIGGNVDWIDGGAATNWNPNDEPDSDDEAIFNTANSVDLGSNKAVNGLTLSGGIAFNTNGFARTVDGFVQSTGAGTNFFFGDAAAVCAQSSIRRGPSQCYP